ncbi:MAG TPA: ABC-2 transporter permease, partial [Candidatus Saccharimonadales bacterium]|nr:ABC-2 transporter permease [Candidatus Saccharimonadales bacterium]
MLSLVLKDLVAGRRLLALILPLGVVQLATFAVVGPIFLLGALVFTSLLAFGSIALEELQGTETLWSSLPVTRGQIVLARYLTVLIGILTGLCLSWAAGQTVIRLGSGPAGAPALVGLRAHAFLISLLLLAAALYLPLLFRFGASKGFLVFSALSVGLLLVLTVAGQGILLLKGYSNPLMDPETWKTAGPELREKLR